MENILIVYSSFHKHTENICLYIARELSQEGYQVKVYDVEAIPQNLFLNHYDGLIVGAPVRMRQFSAHLKQWVRNSLPYFHNKPTAFFSVCLGILQEDAQVQAEENGILENFLKKSLWEPEVKAIFAGGLAYSKYNFFLKLLMWVIARKAGHRTNIFHDENYTDWNQVKKFVERFVQEMKVRKECTYMTLA